MTYAVPRRPRVHPVKRLIGALRLDLSIAVRHLVLNVIAGSALVPRPARWLIYRAWGLDVRTMSVYSGTQITGSSLKVGARTFVNHDCYLDVDHGHIEIGEDCRLAPEVMVLTATHSLDENGHASPQFESHSTVIGNHVWIGARATILPGAVIEDGCVIAAGAVVTGRCAAGGMYGGVPARLIRQLNPTVQAQTELVLAR
jgi:maltose O-acetyltransferase